MDARLQVRVQRYGWDAAALFYETGWQQALLPAQKTLMSMADFEPGQQVIETACGSGLVTRMISNAITPDGKVLSTDLSQQMVELTDSLNLEGVTTTRMASESLEVENPDFDRSICCLGLMYTPDPTKAIAEMYRVLKPGGKAIATVWGERKNCGWADVFPIVDQHVSSEVCPMFFSTGTPGSLIRDFELAGFVDVKESRQAEVLEFGSQRKLLDAVLLGGPVALAMKRFDQETLRAVNEAFLESVSQFADGDSYQIPGEFVTVSGVRPV